MTMRKVRVMLATRIAAIGIAGVFLSLAGQAVVSTAFASGQAGTDLVSSATAATETVVARIVIESVSEHASDRDQGYALGMSRDVRVAGFVREALADIAPAPRTRSEPKSTDDIATGSTAMVEERIESSFEAGAPTVVLGQFAPVPSPRPSAAPVRTAMVQAQPRQTVAAERRPARVVAVSDQTKRKRSLSLPLPRMLGVFH